MKRFNKAALFMAAAFIAFNTQSASAQFQVGAAYGADTEIGINAGYYVSLASVDGLKIGVDGMYYLPQSESVAGYDVDWNYYEVNLNGQYGFMSEESMGLYGLAGIQYAISSFSSNTPGSSDSNDSAIGFNVGVGADIPIGFGSFFVEARYAINGMDQFGAVGGLRFGM